MSLSQTEYVWLLFALVQCFCPKRSFAVKCAARPDFSDAVLVTLLVFQRLSGIDSIRSLCRKHERDGRLMEILGIPRMPNHSLFSHRRETLSSLVERCCRAALILLEAVELLPSRRSQTVLDSTRLPVTSPTRASRCPDPEATTSKSGQGYWHGYKAHVACAAETIPVPLELHVTTAQVADTQKAPELLRACPYGVKHMDKGFDAHELYRVALDETASLPLIARNPRGSKEPGKLPEITDDSPYRDLVHHILKRDDIRTLYRRKRVVVEQLFSQLKGVLRLDQCRFRGLSGQTWHALLCWLAYLVGILINGILGRPLRHLKELFN